MLQFVWSKLRSNSSTGQSDCLRSNVLGVRVPLGVHLNTVLSYNGHYARFWLLRCRFDSCRDYKCGFSSVGGSVGLQNQRSEVRILQPVQMRSYSVGGYFARWTENPEALVRLKVAPQIRSYGEMVNISDFQSEDASSILVSCSILQCSGGVAGGAHCLAKAKAYASSILVHCSNLGRAYGWCVYARLKIWRSCFDYKSTH